jgi:hypothetical protein
MKDCVDRSRGIEISLTEVLDKISGHRNQQIPEGDRSTETGSTKKSKLIGGRGHLRREM